MNISILGPQGSGKGTQAELLVKEFGFSRIETGEILREMAKDVSPTAINIRETMLQGKLVSDEILTEIITERLAKPSKTGFLFDGTPRDLPQYELLKRILASSNQNLDKVILLNINENESMERMASRRTCEVCGRIYNLLTNPSIAGESCECGGKLVQRTDDTPEAIVLRLQKYNERTKPVIDQARNENILVEIDGERPISVINRDIVERLGL